MGESVGIEVGSEDGVVTGVKNVSSYTQLRYPPTLLLSQGAHLLLDPYLA